MIAPTARAGRRTPMSGEPFRYNRTSIRLIMPAARALVRVPFAAFSGVARLTLALAWALVIGIGLFPALLPIVRLVVFPTTDRYRDSITAAIAAQVHQPVE